MYLVLSAIQLDQLPNSFSDPRLLVGLISAIVLLFGARLYRLVLVTPGLLVGVLVGLQLTQDAQPGTQAIAAGCLGVIGAGVLYMVERLAVALVGAVIVAGLAKAFMPLILGAGLPWYVPAAAGMIGVFLLPSLLRAAIRVLTPLLGAIGVSWALGRPGDLILLGGLAIFGALFQLLVLRGRDRDED